MYFYREIVWLEATVLLTVGCGSGSISVAVPLGHVLYCEVKGDGNSRRHMDVRSTVLGGEAGTGLGGPCPLGITLPRALLTAGVSFSNQRAVVAKASWE